MASIDLNSDVGESYGRYQLGDDAAVLDHVSSANVACGMHAGDPSTIATTVGLALARGVAIGAHPGFADLQGFGRRPMQLAPDALYHLVLYQIGALQAFCTAAGTRLAHVKAHGALYNMAVRDSAMAHAICCAVRAVDARLIFYGLAGSELVRTARAAGLTVAEEVFADRSYQDDGSLTPRTDPRAMITDIQQSVEQVLRMVRSGLVRSVHGVDVPVRPDTLCIHGDQPGAAQFAQAIRAALEAEGIAIAPITRPNGSPDSGPIAEPHRRATATP
ncbi:LamB/YcsF family protein [Verminephrobacter eiseniae]|uniref:LamB/YcsF family protein n=1 Tax=Verminephrobacter eiseniae TaxID=364317 RepID=UPI0010DB2729|nr:5-oxoprolinase subunit PxpA [Verminephrobacter eiseniae]KAB7623753.1 LamB/YcsF family protein [Verminephrobacter sp. Larva24]MCW5233198.1 LamB/YcsF family protein [Verminephrobacter eiseniae]MCW5261360.1 LamB/YcsF family protein [Verminephrobacter eiseniae]MCW5295247.1 LamB/YcsF family protein [Verminephrobacter eiseniae]MCW8185650.1 LamB/YcsF family protein [Verminephrobacter eiseniae]